MKILFLTTVLPLNPRSGGEIVSKKIIDEIADNEWSIDVIGFVRTHESGHIKPKNFFSAGKRVIETQGNKKQTLQWLTRAIIKNNAFSTQKYIDKSYIRLVLNKIKDNDYSYIIVDHTQMLWITDYLPRGIKIVLISHNVESELYKNLARDAHNWLKVKLLERESLKMLKHEKNSLPKIEQIWALSEDDQLFYQDLSDALTTNTKCIVFDALPVLSPDPHSSIQTKYDISILGTWTWDANMQGLKWFFEMVYPLISEEINIHVAGKGADWLKGKYSNVVYHGFVDDAREFMLDSKLIVIPSIAGAGVQIKTLDAITVGRPIITTDFALRGLKDYPSYVVAVGTATEMANAIRHEIEVSHPVGYISACINESTDWYFKKKNKFKQLISNNLKISTGD